MNKNYRCNGTLIHDSKDRAITVGDNSLFYVMSENKVVDVTLLSVMMLMTY